MVSSHGTIGGMMQPDGCNEAYDRGRGIATSGLRMSDRIRRAIEVPADPVEVWAALTDPEQLRAWFGADVEIDPRPGGDVRAAWPDGGFSIGSVETADEPRRLVLRWRRIEGVGFGPRVGGATRVAFELEPSADGTSVSVTEEPVELASAVGSP
jgi:uncharacterized protein YndB with AHSA1/START domain